jgi:hypothetical protein
MTSVLNLPVAKKLSGGQPYMSESSLPSADTRTLVILAFSATAGVLVEFYDFAIFGFAVASAFPAIPLPKVASNTSLGVFLLGVCSRASGAPTRWLHLRALW